MEPMVLDLLVLAAFLGALIWGMHAVAVRNRERAQWYYDHGFPPKAQKKKARR